MPPVTLQNESDWSDWRTHRLAGEAQLSRKVARAFGRFFETGALGLNICYFSLCSLCSLRLDNQVYVSIIVGQGIFDRLAELVLKESKGECMLRRSNGKVFRRSFFVLFFFLTSLQMTLWAWVKFTAVTCAGPNQTDHQRASSSCKSRPTCTSCDIPSRRSFSWVTQPEQRNLACFVCFFFA